MGLGSELSGKAILSTKRGPEESHFNFVKSYQEMAVYSPQTGLLLDYQTDECLNIEFISLQNYKK